MTRFQNLESSSSLIDLLELFFFSVLSFGQGSFLLLFAFFLFSAQNILIRRNISDEHFQTSTKTMYSGSWLLSE